MSSATRNIDPEVAHLRAKIAGIATWRPDDPELPKLRRQLAKAQEDAAPGNVLRAVQRANLTRAQRKRLAALILDGGAGK